VLGTATVAAVAAAEVGRAGTLVVAAAAAPAADIAGTSESGERAAAGVAVVAGDEYPRGAVPTRALMHAKPEPVAQLSGHGSPVIRADPRKRGFHGEFTNSVLSVKPPSELQ
jgi:hypothetical protein